MKNRITTETAATYRDLAAQAKAIEDALAAFLLATVQADIPEKAKLATMDWVKRAETFRGLSYFLTPQTEWTGGDSLDERNHVTMSPHIAR